MTSKDLIIKKLVQKMRRFMRLVKKTLKGKSNPWLIIFGVALVFALIYRSFEDFVALHNGAPLEQIDSYRYSPVFSEVLWLVVIATFASMICAIMLKWGKIGAVTLAIVSYIPIGFFAYWGYEYTHQNVTDGILSLLISVLSITTIVATVAIGESYARKRKKEDIKNQLRDSFWPYWRLNHVNTEFSCHRS